MKNHTIALLFIFIGLNLYSQSQAEAWKKHVLSESFFLQNEYLDSLKSYDCSSLLKGDRNAITVGFIGSNYQRFQLKFLTITKKEGNTYTVEGKSKVQNNICRFSGTITITNAKILEAMHWGLDDEFKNKGIKKQGVLIANYEFFEDSVQQYSGKFEGVLSIQWYIDSEGKLKLDDIESYSDSYRNNQFVGTWKSYKKQFEKTCNWGDYRIPYSGDLDDGAAFFAPANKFIANGWETYNEAMIMNNAKAIEEEKKEWWK